MRLIKIIHALVLVVLGLLTWLTWQSQGIAPSAEWGNFFLASVFGFAIGCMISRSTGNLPESPPLILSIGMSCFYIALATVPCYLIPAMQMRPLEPHWTETWLPFFGLTPPLIFFSWPRSSEHAIVAEAEDGFPREEEWMEEQY